MHVPTIPHYIDQEYLDDVYDPESGIDFGMVYEETEDGTRTPTPRETFLGRVLKDINLSLDEQERATYPNETVQDEMIELLGFVYSKSPLDVLRCCVTDIYSTMGEDVIGHLRFWKALVYNVRCCEFYHYSFKVPGRGDWSMFCRMLLRCFAYTVPLVSMRDLEKIELASDVFSEDPALCWNRCQFYIYGNYPTIYAWLVCKAHEYGLPLVIYKDATRTTTLDPNGSVLHIMVKAMHTYWGNELMFKEMFLPAIRDIKQRMTVEDLCALDRYGQTFSDCIEQAVVPPVCPQHVVDVKDTLLDLMRAPPKRAL